MDIFKKDKAAFGPLDELETFGMVDARFGNPAFLHPYWEHFDNNTIFQGGKKMGYLDAYGTDEMKQNILMLHLKIDNADITQKHVVFGVGASQLVSAAVHALSLDGPKKVYVKPPYFSRFQQFTQFAGTGIKFCKKPPKDKFIEIVTCPNNPNASMENKPTGDLVIHDLVYNWPQYTEVVPYNEDIMIFGLAKATGHASTRVGWALVKDKSIADKMEHYVEMSTCGVGIESLEYANKVVRFQEHCKYGISVFAEGKDILDSRWKRIKEVMPKHIELLNDRGMFAWGKVKKGKAVDEFMARGIIVVSGKYFGMTDKYFRINMGLDKTTFYEMIGRLR